MPCLISPRSDKIRKVPDLRSADIIPEPGIVGWRNALTTECNRLEFSRRISDLRRAATTRRSTQMG